MTTSDGRNDRAAIIAGWDYAATAAGPPPSVAPPVPSEADGEGSPADIAIDAKITDALAKIEADIDDALKLQATDPGTTAGDGPDVEVGKALQLLKSALNDAKAAQAEDAPPADANDPAAGPDAAPTTPAPPNPTTAPAASSTATFAPGDSAKPPAATTLPPPPAGVAPSGGSVPAATVCADCMHLADAHEGSTNLGRCTMEQCSCPAMTVPDNGQGNDDTMLSAESSSFAAPPNAVDAIDATTDADNAPANANTPDGDPVADDPNQALAPGQVNGPAFIIPIGVTEGIPTSDGRMIAPDALTWRTPPLPLMAMWENDEGHKGAKLIGRIDEVFRDGPNVGARGVFDSSVEGLDAARMVAAGMFKGVSVDIVDASSEVTVTAMDDDGFPMDVAEVISTGEIAGWTITPFPAFAGAYITLDADSDDDHPVPIPQMPSAGDPVVAGINVITFRDCEPCRTGEALAASAGPMAPPASWYEDPGLDELTPLTVDDNGRVFGHLAPWGTCHTGVAGTCVVAPHSSTDYAYFRTGTVVTAEGDTIATGPLTVGTGHASTRRGVSPGEAMAHYDHTGTAVADVAVGEDSQGIWVAGSIRPGASEEQVYALRASALSGDWRRCGRGLELVAALAVNTPGFPLVKAVTASGSPVALVSAGTAAMEALRPHDDALAASILATPSTMERALMPLLDDSAAVLRRRMLATRPSA